MCSPMTCRTCGKTTWSGCGQHVAEVKAQVPDGQWCDGHSGASPSAPPRLASTSEPSKVSGL